jgi:hypothetical protein
MIAWAAARSEGSGSMISRRGDRLRRPPRAPTSAPRSNAMWVGDDDSRCYPGGSRTAQSRSAPRRRPPRRQKAAALQLLREQLGALAVVPDHPQQSTKTLPEAEGIAAEGVLLQKLLDPPRESAAHIRVAGGQPDPAPKGTGIIVAPVWPPSVRAPRGRWRHRQ